MSFPYTKWLTVAFATSIIIAMPLNLFIALFQLSFIYSSSTFTANGQYRSSIDLITDSVSLYAESCQFVSSSYSTSLASVLPLKVALNIYGQ